MNDFFNECIAILIYIYQYIIILKLQCLNDCNPSYTVSRTIENTDVSIKH